MKKKKKLPFGKDKIAKMSPFGNYGKKMSSHEKMETKMKAKS